MFNNIFITFLWNYSFFNCIK